MHSFVSLFMSAMSLDSSLGVLLNCSHCCLAAQDTSSMSKEQKINFLLHLHEKLQHAVARLAQATNGAGQQSAQQQQQQGPASAAGGALASTSSIENEGALANVAPMQIDSQAAVIGQHPYPQPHQQQPFLVIVSSKPALAPNRPAAAKRKPAGRRKQVQQAGSSTEEEEPDWCAANDHATNQRSEHDG
jgi:hypothetical protein